MTESLFKKCNSCGKIVDWFHYGSLCEECGQNTFSPLKELYVVCSEREKDVLSDAFNVLHINSYEISVLPIHNDCNLYGNNLIFPFRPTVTDKKKLFKKLRLKTRQILKE